MLSILQVTTTFDRLIGAYACQIELLTSISDLMALVKNDNFHFELIASLNNGITASSQLKIGIGVIPAEISLEQVDQQVISVTGLEKVLQKVEVRGHGHFFTLSIQEFIVLFAFTIGNHI